MYLGMTDEDYRKVYDTTPRIVGERIGLSSASDLSPEEVLGQIEINDSTAFKIMEIFRSTYSEWWDLSKQIAETDDPERLSDLRNQLKTKIFARDEIRKSLISYLNFKYGKANGNN